MATAEEEADWQKKISQLIGFALQLNYHPAKPNPYSDKEEHHTDQTTVIFQGRRATVDTGIAPLIGELWRLSAHTIGSCEEYRDGNAYIQFPGMICGAGNLIKVIKAIGQACEVDESERENGFGFVQGGEKFGGVWFRLVTIRFNPGIIEALTQFLRNECDSKGKAAYELVRAEMGGSSSAQAPSDGLGE